MTSVHGDGIGNGSVNSLSLADRALRARANGGVEPGGSCQTDYWWLKHICKETGKDGWPILIADRSTRLESHSDLKKWLQRIGAPEGLLKDREIVSLWSDLISNDTIQWWSDDIILIKSGCGYNMKTGKFYETP